jgi:predicted TIM-barrel fold metal-dependent hydrolase
MVKHNPIRAFAEENLEKEFSTLSSKYAGPKFDAHTHVWSIKTLEKHFQYAQNFNVQRLLVILNRGTSKKLSPDLQEKCVFARFLPSLKLLLGNSNNWAKMIDKYYSQGFSIIKLWYAPRFRVYLNKFVKVKDRDKILTDPIFEPLFSRIEDLRLIFLVHNSDPDLWYQNVYQPESKYGSKERHLQEFEEFLKMHPKMKVLGAHFGAQPENLENLGRWFDIFPNYYVDASSARWMAREFSQNRVNSIEFFKKYHDRILWGTDLSFGMQRGKNIPSYYYTRYLTYQALLETKVTDLPLPFPDRDNLAGTVINGLDLPINVLEDIYWNNANKLFNKK